MPKQAPGVGKKAREEKSQSSTIGIGITKERYKIAPPLAAWQGCQAFASFSSLRQAGYCPCCCQLLELLLFASFSLALLLPLPKDSAHLPFRFPPTKCRQSALLLTEVPKSNKTIKSLHFPYKPQKAKSTKKTQRIRRSNLHASLESHNLLSGCTTLEISK